MRLLHKLERFYISGMEGPDRFEIPRCVEEALVYMQLEVNRRYWTRDGFGFTYAVEGPCSEDPVIRLLISCEGASLQACLSLNELVARADAHSVRAEFQCRLDDMDRLLARLDAVEGEEW